MNSIISLIYTLINIKIKSIIKNYVNKYDIYVDKI